MKKKALVVGAGITGATIARLLNNADFDVTIIEQTNEVGGACSDTFENFAYKQNHGSHIFHTNNIDVMTFLGSFMKLRPYIHKVKGLINGSLVPIPINLNSIEQIFSKEYIDMFLDKLCFNKEYTFEELKEASDFAKTFADWIYINVFKFYSTKQWDKIPDVSTLSRVKAFRHSKDDRYFLDKWQGLPAHGFTALIKDIITKDTTIPIYLNTKAEPSMFKDYDVVFYTGTIDEIFDFKLGKLPYRTCKFEYECIPIYKSQEAAVINYTQDYAFTRSHDYSWYFPSQNSFIAYEYPKQHESEDEPRYYPIKEDENLKLYDDYKKLLAKEYPNVIPAGRLGTYKYLNMDQAVEQAMKLVEKYLEKANC